MASSLQFLADFKVLHEKARNKSLTPAERIAYTQARVQFSRFVVMAQSLGHAGQTLRSNLRMAKMLKVEVRPDAGDPIRGSTVDLASGGFALLVPRSMVVGKGAAFTLNLPREAISGRCVVASSRNQAGLFRVSFKFENLTPDAEEHLAVTLIDAVLERLGAER
jgi:hypothetical protein